MIKSFLKPEHHWPPDDAWVYHIQKGHKKLPHHEQTLMIAGDTFGEIDSLQKYVKYGQATHVEMMRAEFESARRDFPNNGGTMMWMFNDCWPTSNWSIIDYSKNPKPSYYAAKRACAPLLPIIFQRNENIEFLLSNQSMEDVELSLEYGQSDLLGNETWVKRETITVKRNTTKFFDRVPLKDLNMKNDEYLFIKSNIGDENRQITYFPNGWRDIHWPNPKVEIRLIDQKQIGNRWETLVKIHTTGYARLLHLLPSSDDSNPAFEDNYFDLPAGSTKEIMIKSLSPIVLEDLKIGHWLTEWE
ncbi:MAG TPA: hypothetical protein DDZ89_12385 [Clostridiales bacterium]|nr:hypothetical protein [Clostridiales bacterium]